MFLPLGDDLDRRNLPIVPTFLILANVLVYVYQVRIGIEAGADDPILGQRAIIAFWKQFGLIPTELMEGEVMGLLSHMFMHGDFFHILGNMIVLWAFACSLESGLGAATLLGLYLFWGVASGGCHAYMNLESDMPLVGASGAISGLMGAYLVAYGPQANIKCLVYIAVRPFVARIPAMAFCGFWIMGQMWEASNDPNGISGIAWYAHLGGFAVGVVTMFLLRNDMENNLVRDKSGNLVFAENSESVAAKEQQKLAAVQASGASSLPEDCPYCGTAISEELIINPMMARCANEDCEHLIYPQQLVC